MARHSAEQASNVNILLAGKNLPVFTDRTFPTYDRVPKTGAQPVVAEQGAEHFTSFQQRMQALAKEVAKERSKPRTVKKPLRRLDAHTTILERLRSTPAPKQLELSRATEAAKQNVQNATTEFDKKIARREWQKAVQAQRDYNDGQQAKQQELAEAPPRRVKRLVKPLGQVASNPAATKHRPVAEAEARPRPTPPAAVESLLARLGTNGQLIITENQASVTQAAGEALSDEALARTGNAEIAQLAFSADEPPTVVTRPVDQAGSNQTQYASISNQFLGQNIV